MQSNTTLAFSINICTLKDILTVTVIHNELKWTRIIARTAGLLGNALSI
jgi:hypothetical protein